MSVIGPRCHELRVNDETKTWRIMVRNDPDAILILDVFAKKTQKTPTDVLEACKRRLRAYDEEK
jgi:phage-related protein